MVIKKFLGLTKTFKKKGPTTKQNPQKNPQNPPSFNLFAFIVLLHVGVIIILLVCSRKWLLSYAPLSPQILETRFTTNLNGIATRFPTSPLLIQIGTKHGSWTLHSFFLSGPITNFSSLPLFVLLHLTFSLSYFFSVVLTSEHKETMATKSLQATSTHFLSTHGIMNIIMNSIEG